MPLLNRMVIKQDHQMRFGDNDLYQCSDTKRDRVRASILIQVLLLGLCGICCRNPSPILMV